MRILICLVPAMIKDTMDYLEERQVHILSAINTENFDSILLEKRFIIYI